MILSFAHIKDRGLEIEGCEHATIGNFLMPTATPSHGDGEKSTDKQQAADNSGTVALKINSVNKDKIELEWDWASNDKITSALLPAIKRANTPTSTQGCFNVEPPPPLVANGGQQRKANKIQRRLQRHLLLALSKRRKILDLTQT